MMDVHAPKVRDQIERAQRCLANGYPPVPILRPDAPGTVERNGKVVRKSPGKEPHNALWARKERDVYGATARTVEGWERLRDIADHPGLGLACGRAAAADVDVYDRELADAIEALAVEFLGATPLRRVGQPPKRLLLYRVEGDPLPKTQTPELLKGDLKAKVEVLGQGQQFVAFGVHPVTGVAFAWDDGTPETTPLDELPAVTRDQVEFFVAEAEHLLREAGYRTKAEIEAETPAHRMEPPKAGAKPTGNGASDASPFKAVNAEAMRRIEAWVRELFPTARRQAGTGAWRVPSRDLGRQLEEDLSIAPGGIVDFGVHDQGDPRHGKRTPIDLVMEFGGAADATQAARWLADHLSMTLEIGRRARRNGTEAEAGPDQARAGGAAPATGDAPFDLSHDGLALDLGREWEAGARHVALWGRWLFWTGGRWEPDEKLLHLTRAREYLRRRADGLVRAAKAGEIESLDVDKAEAIAKGLRSAQTVAHVVGLARSNRGQAASVGQWDADPWRLNTPAGIVDLRTGELRPPDPLAYCTKSTAVAPAPPGTPAPLWQAFLERIFRHDPELIGFMQRVLGYGLTGLTIEHVLIFAWGQGANGKGTLFNTASRLLGDYAAVAPADLLLVTQSDRHPTDLAMLRGRRLVTAQELAPGRAWDEPKLKSLTGGDPITARFMRQDFFTYEPQFLLVAAGNHKPSFKGVDEAIRRRVQLVPFLQNIPAEERDKRLPEKLKAEWPAILRWLIDGCLAWQREDLSPPASVREASEEYLSAEDVLGQWLEERCAVSVTIEFTKVSALYGDWKQWCERGGLPAGSSKAFSQRLSERGFRSKKISVVGLVGIGLRAEPGHDCGSDEPTREDREDGQLLGVWRARARTHTHTSHIGETSLSSLGAPDEPEGFDL